ncbi:hypothetical protein OWV82_008880 [Melia azedarach]|uniref:Uncharacterized protein n=1 Tax=Melia azedarach TaxID=155640 RepID=A0ACC1YDE3_MELAZ|nr:hypothetical protein OWV82_008880 [Melia azedarach]
MGFEELNEACERSSSGFLSAERVTESRLRTDWTVCSDGGKVGGAAKGVRYEGACNADATDEEARGVTRRCRNRKKHCSPEIGTKEEKLERKSQKISKKGLR